MMCRFVSSLFGILMAIVLVLSVASAPAAAGEVPDGKVPDPVDIAADTKIEDLESKEVLCESEWEDIGRLSPEAREGVLLKRGWTRAVCPEDINSYADLISEEAR